MPIAFAVSLLAGGWVEAHLTKSDAHLRVEQDAHAAVDVSLGYRVVAGTLHSVVVDGARFDTIEPSAEVRAEDGSAQMAGIIKDGEKLEIAFDGKGLRRGSYVVHLRGSVALAPTHGLDPDGQFWRVGWSSPIANEGLDGSRVVFDLPAAPTEPRAVRADTAPGEIDERDAFGIVATLHRNAAAGIQRDELELVRPHVARGESAVWAARVDPKAFPGIAHPALRPASIAPSIPPPQPVRGPLAALLAATGALFAMLVFLKARRARPIVPGAFVLAGAAMAGAVWLEAIRQTTWAAFAIAGAMFFATFRPRRARRSAGGVWIPVALEEPLFDPFDATRPAGAAVALGIVIALVALARVLTTIDPLAPIWTALDAVALVPVFLTGARRSESEILRRLRARLAGIRTAVLGHVSREGAEPNEVRLHAQPSAPLPGLVSLEVAVRWDRSGSSAAPALEALARIRAESAAHARLLGLSAPVPSMREPGRKPDERVFRYAPEAHHFERDLRTLFSVLEERRQSSSPIAHADRRGVRVSSPANAPAH